MKTTIQLVLSFTILCLVATTPTIQAVVPPPDGGYPGGNTAEGQNALLDLTTGSFNTAVGWVSLQTDTTGSFNTALGAGTLFRNNGHENTAVGTGALLTNSTGTQNTATGAFALFSNSGGPIDSNRPSGDPGTLNTANGNQALFSNTTGSTNTAVGAKALFNNVDGSGNTATGSGALFENTAGLFNTAVGISALGNSTGDGNLALGAFAGTGVTSADNVIAIGAGGQNVSNSCFIGNIYSNIQPTVGTDPDLVTINSSGRLGRANVSSRRYKHDIQPMQTSSEAIYALKPVSFRYHKEYDRTQTIAFGLIAEEVAEVNSDLVGRNREGQPESVRYEQINAMLLNEFLKAHGKVQEQTATISELQATVAQQQKTFDSRLAEQQKQIEALTEGLQKVSAQIELHTLAPNVARNNQ